MTVQVLRVYTYRDDRSVGFRVQFQGQLQHEIGSKVPLDQRQTPRNVKHGPVEVRGSRKVRKHPRQSNFFQELKHRFVSQIV